ncbi:MAG: prepilin-type N-terminal cleavage/methylation domain-containing protein [Patescibacteria group bacterium]
MTIFSIGGKNKSYGCRPPLTPPSQGGGHGGVRGCVPGFSLMEMLIVVAIFSVTVLVLAQTFASFNQLHRRISNATVLNQDMRFITESLARAVRQYPLVFVGGGLPSKQNEIRLNQPNGNIYVVMPSAEGDPICEDLLSISCLLLSKDGGVTWTPMTGKRVDVERFDVYARPPDSPFELVGGAYPNDIQPFVTFSIKLRYAADNPKDDTTLEVQSTVSSRMYQR